MGTNLIRAMLLASAGITAAAAATPTAAYAQEASYQIDIPAQSMGDALRALGKATKHNIVFKGALVKGKRSAAVRGRMSAGEALDRMLQGSGLKMSRGSGGGLVVQADVGNGEVADLVDGFVTGQVTDADTGRRLSGAVVRVRESGQSVTTDESGRYRIAQVQSATITLDVTFLGYGAQSGVVNLGRNGQGKFNFAMGAEGEIVVYASRSARALALNRERAADNNSTVISSDLLGDLPGATLADALKRAPGVAFSRNEQSGDGENISVRGLAPPYNQVTMNGVPLAPGEGPAGGRGRAPNLSNILADSVDEVVISKTLLPSQDSSGTGGLVDIKTKSPLDRPRRYASVAAEGVNRAKGFGENYLLSGTVSGRFGASENFGITVSGQYRKQNQATYRYNLTGELGEYLPLDVAGNPLPSLDTIDPRTIFPFDPGAPSYQVTGATVARGTYAAETKSFSVAAEWQLDDSTNLRIDYTKSINESVYDETTSNVVSLNSTELRPIAQLGDEERYARRFIGFMFISPGASGNRSDQTTDALTFNGSTKVGSLSLRSTIGYSTSRSTLGDAYSVSIGSLGAFNPIPDSNFLPQAVNSTTGVIASAFGPLTGRGLQLPLLTEAGYSSLLARTYTFLGMELPEDQFGKSRVWTNDFAARYEFKSPLVKYIEIGGTYKESLFDNTFLGIATSIFGRPRGDDMVPAAEYGFTFSDLNVASIMGASRDLPVLDPRSLPSAIATIRSQIGVSPYIGAVDYNSIPPELDGMSTRERDLVAYVQGHFQVGKLEIIGGIRGNTTRVSSDIYSAPSFTSDMGVTDGAFSARNAQIINIKATQTDYLPRVLANYRISENLVVRLGYYMSVARPNTGLLTSAQTVGLDLQPFYGPEFNRPQLSVNKGNPALKPATTNSFDLNVERYFPNGSAIKLGAYYKSISNLLESAISGGSSDITGIDLPNDPQRPEFQNLPADVFVLVTQPINNPDRATIWGVEASAEVQLTFLPGAMAGLGVSGNFNWSKSSKNQPYTWFFKPVLDSSGQIVTYETENITFENVPFNDHSRQSYTVGLTYNKYGFDGSIYYSRQARTVGSYAPNGLWGNTEAISTLDARLEYNFGLKGAKARLYIEGADLLRGRSGASSTFSNGGAFGAPILINSRNYQGGRTVTGGFSINF